MNKPKEFWTFDPDDEAMTAKVYVIEKSAYDELAKDLEKAIAYLKEGKARFAPNTTNSFVDDLINKYNKEENK